MSITIDKESRQQSKLSIDIGFMGDTYKTSTGLFTFPSPTLWTIEKNLFFLLRNSTQKEFDKQYKMKPSYLSYDEYGTVALDKLLMFVNGVKCIENFNLDTVVVPSFQSILTICYDKYSKKDVSRMTEVAW